MGKKEKEKTSLTLIYDENDFAEIIETERPDFRIRHEHENTYFGVEITEFHHSESDARLRHLPNYFQEILHSNEYCHKKDKDILKVQEFTVTSSEGEDKGSIPGVLRELPPVEDYVQMFVQTLARKEKKMNEYKRNLDHVNLVVLDTMHRISTAPIEDFYYHFFTTSLKKALYASEFREIFLIIILAKERRVHVPLKLVLLLANLYMFAEIATDSPPELTETSSEESDSSTRDFMLAFAAYLRSKTDNVCVREDDGQIEVVFGNSGVVLEEERTVIRDYNDHPLPKDLRTVGKNETALFSNAEFRKREEEVLKNYTFSTELAYDVKGKVGF